MAENEEEKKQIKENKETPKKETAKKEAPKKEKVEPEKTKVETPKAEAPKEKDVKVAEPKKDKVEPVKEEKKFEPVKAKPDVKKATTSTASTKAGKEKKKSIVFRTIVIAIVLLAIVGLIYVALPSPARTVQQMLRELKAGNYEKLEEYVDYEELMDDPVISSDDTEKSKLFFQDLQFTVKNVTQKGDTATIELQTSNKNFKVIVENAAKKLLQKYFSSEDAEIDEILLEELQKEDIPPVTITKEITVQKQDGKWKVVADDNLKEAIFPGLQESLDAVTNGDMF